MPNSTLFWGQGWCSKWAAAQSLMCWAAFSEASRLRRCAALPQDAAVPRITIAPCPRIYTPIPRLTLPPLSRARRLGRSGIHWSFASSANSLTAAISATINPGQADLLAGERLFLGRIEEAEDVGSNRRICWSSRSADYTTVHPLYAEGQTRCHEFDPV